MRSAGHFFRFPFVLATATALVMLGIGCTELWTSIRFMCCGTTVTGSILARYPKVYHAIDIWRRLRRFSDPIMIDYSFVDASGTQHTGKDDAPLAALRPDDRVLVDYLKDNPEENRLRPVFGWFSVMVIGAGFVFVGILLLGIPYHAQRRLSKAEEWEEFLREKKFKPIGNDRKPH